MTLKKTLAAALMLCMAAPTLTASASEFDIKDLLGGLGDAVQNGSVTDMLQGVLATSNLSIEDLAGEWTSTGSAVCFQSENFLKKAGGAAVATTLENKINPYYKKLGLDGAVFTIKTDGTFTLKVSKFTLNGTIEKNSKDNNFIFNFSALGGSMKIASITTYVQKTSSSMDVMFDADKLITLLNAIAKITGSNIGNTVTSLLNGYDGLCIGFKLNRTGNVEGQQQSSGSLLDLFGGGSKSTSTSTDTQKITNQQNTSGTENALDRLRNILGGSKK